MSLYENDDAAGLYIVGVAQPNYEEAKRPDYDGTMLRPLEADYVARLLSHGLQAMPLAMEHADLGQEHGQRVPDDKRIGKVVEAWHDPEYGVMCVGFIPASRPEAAAIERDIVEKGEKYGFSFYTDYKKIPNAGTVPEFGKVVETELTHLGVTKQPAWQSHDTWVYEWSRDPLAIRKAIRERYLGRPGATIPSAMAERMRQSETKDAYEIERRARARAAANSGAVLLRSVMASSAAPESTPAPVTPAAPTPAPSAAEQKLPQFDVPTRVGEYELRATQANTYTNAYEKLSAFRDLLAEMDADVKSGRLDATAAIDTSLPELRKKLREHTKVLEDSLVQFTSRADNGMSEAARNTALAMLKMQTGGHTSEEARGLVRTICSSVAASQSQYEKDQRMLEEERAAKRKAAEENAEKDKKLGELERERADLKRKYDELVATTLKPKDSATIAAEVKAPAPTPAEADANLHQIIASTTQAAAGGRGKGPSSSLDDLAKKIFGSIWSEHTRTAKSEPFANRDGMLPAQRALGITATDPATGATHCTSLQLVYDA
jgi:hypothetical protein